MEINITKIINDMPDVYGSRLTHGENAGEITWNAAVSYAQQNSNLTLKESNAVKRYMKEFGAWSENEIEAWNDVELYALFTQLVIAEFIESGIDNGSIFKTSDNEYYFAF